MQDKADIWVILNGVAGGEGLAIERYIAGLSRGGGLRRGEKRQYEGSDENEEGIRHLRTVPVRIRMIEKKSGERYVNPERSNLFLFAALSRYVD